MPLSRSSIARLAAATLLVLAITAMAQPPGHGKPSPSPSPQVSPASPAASPSARSSPAPRSSAAPPPSPAASPTVAPSPSVSPANLPPVQLLLALAGQQLGLGSLRCTSVGRTCKTTAQIGGPRCGGQACAASVMCVFTDPAHGTCSLDVSPCGARLSCAASARFSCFGTLCQAMLVVAITPARPPALPWWQPALGLLILLLVAAYEVRRRSRHAVAAGVNGSVAAAAARAPAAQGVELALVSQRPRPFVCRAMFSEHGWTAPGVIFLLRAELAGEPAGAEAWLDAGEAGAYIDRAGEPDGILRAELLGARRIKVTASSPVDLDFSVGFSPALERLLQLEQGQDGVPVRLDVRVAVTLDDAVRETAASFTARLHLNRSSGRVEVL